MRHDIICTNAIHLVGKALVPDLTKNLLRVYKRDLIAVSANKLSVDCKDLKQYGSLRITWIKSHST